MLGRRELEAARASGCSVKAASLLATSSGANAHPDDTTKRSLFNDEGPLVAQVPIRVLDELVGSGDVELPHGIDAVKIDVEGAELRVLTGMRRTLERHRPRVMVIETIERVARRRT